jgi:hypothetical protein
MCSNNPYTEDELKESTESTVFWILWADDQYTMKTVLCFTQVCEPKETILMTFFFK